MPQLLVYVPLSQSGSEPLFDIFSRRYENGATIVTSNLPFQEWTSVFASEWLTGTLLDHLDDRRRLQETVARIAPRLVVLDPLVRLHGVDENTVADVAPILGSLRDLQRRFETAVLLVHHARKSGATRPG